MTDREKLDQMVQWFLMSSEEETSHLNEAFAFLYAEGYVDFEIHFDD